MTIPTTHSSSQDVCPAKLEHDAAGVMPGIDSMRGVPTGLRSIQVKSTAFPAIDALRAMAALLLLVFHVIWLGDWQSFPKHGAWQVFRAGWIGVDLFLVISGFVIAFSALKDYERRPDGFRKRFLVRRLARIVPLYMVTSAAYLFLVDPTVLKAPFQEMMLHIVAHLLFIHNLIPDTFGSINGSNWSVGLEMQFYLLMVLIIPWLAHRRPALLLLVVPLAMLYRYGTTLFFPPGVAHQNMQLIVASQLPGLLDQFMWGIGLGMLVHRQQGWLSRRLVPGWVNCLCWSAIAAVSLFLVLGVLLQTLRYYENQYMIIFWRSFLGASFACLVAAAITFPGAGWTVLRPIRYLGEISYGIYLWHVPVTVTLAASSGFGGHVLLLWVFTGAVCLSALSWHLMERPAIERFRSPGRIA